MLSNERFYLGLKIVVTKHVIQSCFIALQKLSTDLKIFDLE